MGRRGRWIAGWVLMVLMVLGAISTPAHATDVRLGVLAFRGTEAAAGEWQPVIERLQRALPAHRFTLAQFDHDGLRAAVAAQQLEFVITNPGHYVELEAEFGASRILTLAAGQAQTSSRAVGSAIITRAERRDIARLADLRGQRVATVGREGFGGFQIVWRELAQQDIDPQRDLAALQAVGFPMDRVIDALERGEADVGILRTCVLESLPAARRARFKVVDARVEPGFPCATSTRLYPDWPMATLRQTPPALAREVAIALLTTPATDGAVTWNVPADYQAVHELFRELEIGPYAYLRAPTLLTLAQRYWPLVAVLALALAGWIFYTVRVEQLVHVRTRALRSALEAREALQARMRANQEQADHLARLSILGELSGTLAHELNQPLASIGNYAQSLLRRADNGRLTDAAVREAAAEVVAQAERAAGILGRIRSFARKRPVQREVRDLGELARESVDLFRGMLSHAPEVVIEEAGNVRAQVDALQIQQVLLNLLKNADDAMQGQPANARRIVVRLGRDATLCSIQVADIGPGMTDDARTHLFEPFFTTKPNGMGLGLSICSAIAEAHGGRLSAAPAAAGPGMVFTLSIPAA